MREIGWLQMQAVSGRGCQIGKTGDCSTDDGKTARAAVSVAVLHAGPGRLQGRGRDPGNLGTGSVSAADRQRPEETRGDLRSSGSQALCSVSE